MKARTRRTMVATMVLVAISTSQAQTGNAKARAAIDASVARLVSAANHANLDGVIGEFRSDAVMISGGELYPDFATMRASWGPAFKALRSQDIRVEQSTTRFLSPTSAVYTARGTFTGTDTSGVTSAPRRFTWTMVYAADKGGWKISSAHQAFASIAAPSAEADAKAAIEASVARMTAAASRLDGEGIAAEMAADGQFLNGTAVLANPEEFRTAVVPAFKGLRRHDVALYRSKTTLLSPGAAVFTGVGRYINEDANGTPSTGEFAMTVAYRLDKGAWKGVSFHEAVTPTPAVAQAGTPSAPAQYQSAAMARFDVVPGAPKITNAQLYGDANADAPHGEFTKFAPGFDAGRHSHTNTVTIVVVKGAYLYRDEAGDKRVAAGDWLRIPAGKVHWSGGDAKEGATFYVHMDAKMDSKPAQ